MNRKNPPAAIAGYQPKVPLELSEGRLHVTLDASADDSWRPVPIEISAEQAAALERLWAEPRVESCLKRYLRERLG
jgi:hypothetical protein